MLRGNGQHLAILHTGIQMELKLKSGITLTIVVTHTWLLLGTRFILAWCVEEEERL